MTSKSAPAGPPAGTGILEVHQRLTTTGARSAVPFQMEGALHLAVPQLAADIPGQPAHMNGGNSDVDTLLYKWRDGLFEPAERLAVPGGEDALAFQIGKHVFLATASVRTGSGPYDMNVLSKIFRREAGAWVIFQELPTFAAKKFYYFHFNGRHFLALAQGVTLPNADARHPCHSCIFEWDGGQFVEFQRLEGRWGYNWTAFELAGELFLGYADHTSASLLYRWNGVAFEPYQRIADQGGRAFAFFESDGNAWLAFATLFGDSVLYRWNGSQFTLHQTLGGPGGRELELIRINEALYLTRVCFIQGAPASPKTDLLSQIYKWEAGRFSTVQEFATFGGTHAAAFETGDERFLAVSNSLSADVRFQVDTIIYRLHL